MRACSKTVALGVLLLAAAIWPSAAGAAETATLHASFSPDRLGASTTIGFGFDMLRGERQRAGAACERRPAAAAWHRLPLHDAWLGDLPAGGAAGQGLVGLPANSRLGHGSAYVEVPFGQSSGREIPDIEALMGPPHAGNIVVLFYADGREPIDAQLVFQGELIAGTQTLGGSLDAAVPLVPSVPGGPAVSIVRVNATIGPAGLTYYEHVHGRRVSFHPKGVSVPLHCPHGGFPFSAQFTFKDGTSTLARSMVPCPRRR